MPTDVARMADALSRPGIDPRTWTTLAVVTARTVDATGVHFAITTITGVEETAALAPTYGGAGFGLYAPIDVGTMVVVEFPEGDPNTGGRVIGACWDKGTPPPADLSDPTRADDFLLVVKEGNTCRLRVSGAGDVKIIAEGTGKVKLGAEAGTGPIALKTDLDGYKLALLARATVGIPAEITQLTPGLPGTQPQIDQLIQDALTLQAVLRALTEWPIGALKVEGI